MLTLAGIAFIGIGMFRYTPHPILHNVFARGLPCLMSVLMIALPWLAPQLSKVVYVISDLAIVIGALAGFQWLAGRNTLTNVEALAGMMFLGWFIIFHGRLRPSNPIVCRRSLFWRKPSGQNPSRILRRSAKPFLEPFPDSRRKSNSRNGSRAQSTNNTARCHPYGWHLACSHGYQKS